MKASRSRKRLVWLGALLTSTLVAVVGAELFVRCFMPPPPLFAYSGDRGVTSESGGKMTVLAPEDRRLEPGSRLLMRHHPTSGRTVEINANSLGLRNPELGPRRPGVPRILFVGDSITIADYLPEEDGFVRLVEDLARQHGQAWEAVNGGLSGTGLERQLALLTSLAPIIQPDLVVLDLYLNDFQESPSIQAPAPPLWALRSWLVGYAYALLEGRQRVRFGEQYLEQRRARNQAWKAEVAAAFATLEPECPGESAFREAVEGTIYEWGGAWVTENRLVVEKRLGQIAALLHEQQIELQVVHFPSRKQVEARCFHNYPQRYAQARLHQLGVGMLDLLPVLRQAHAESEGQLFYDHCHLTEHGNRVVAAPIFEFLASELDQSA